MRQVGQIGEMIAAEYLEEKNYRILERNFCFRNGEVDLIAACDNLVVFVEVKTTDLRTGKKHPFGEPETWLTKRKQSFLYKSAEYYIWKKAIKDKDFRFDLITVRLGEDSNTVDHYENAFWKYKSKSNSQTLPLGVHGIPAKFNFSGSSDTVIRRKEETIEFLGDLIVV